jgi:hypothetical protein
MFVAEPVAFYQLPSGAQAARLMSRSLLTA